MAWERCDASTLGVCRAIVAVVAGVGLKKLRCVVSSITGASICVVEGRCALVVAAGVVAGGVAGLKSR